ncbi:hypothetical protein [Pseudorhizobium flavum]|uniref:DUF2946 domain-containing protein n=1 Tax=Pseudorhizobium flavum TaxID=1335061 RepID=A0A7X0DED9_9HYPH|nr:hypothetical protein [Pseudorhizobium flavum]MBB6181893.1 hypothetical protein [Pseudorhizobium flavum]MBU1312807.1 hypothetical protein [Alphaproteobacteria bacterium]MBU1551985.1 hypothetical protein [Alphaproteobacteria bacterium]MBU2388173.1 hypothetical protein [Alphaproteobacteria bacterium]
MSRITSRAMLLIVRLVVVLSLAGYSISAVNAAMHPSSSSASVSMIQDVHSSHGAHKHHVLLEDGLHADQGDEASKGSSSKTCCQDYCGVFAITCAMPKFAHPQVESITDYMNDVRTFGESPALHRPPNI